MEMFNKLLKQIVAVDIPIAHFVSKNKITVIWQDKNEQVYTFQVYADNHSKMMKKVAKVIDRIKIKKGINEA